MIPAEPRGPLGIKHKQILGVLHYGLLLNNLDKYFSAKATLKGRNSTRFHETLRLNRNLTIFFLIQEFRLYQLKVKIEYW